jgi:hypothetical protein
MKKISILVVLALLLCGSAFAMQCEDSQAAGGPEACWTVATLSNGMTSAIMAGGVSVGTVFVYDTASGQLGQSGNSTTLTLAQTGATLVKLSTVSADNSKVAGVLQVSLDSAKVGAGSQVRLLVRGLGDIITNGDIAITSGDPLIVRVATGSGTNGAVAAWNNSTTQRPIATALETYSTATATKKKAIIQIV